jgi:hypothetical protein
MESAPIAFAAISRVKRSLARGYTSDGGHGQLRCAAAETMLESMFNVKRSQVLRLAALIAMAAGLLAAQTPIDGQYYVLRAPGGLNHWFLAATEQQAASIYAFRDDDKITPPYLGEHEASGDLIRYSDGIVVNQVSRRAYSSLVRAQDGTEGWVTADLLDLTPDAKQKVGIEGSRIRALQIAAEDKSRAEHTAAIQASFQASQQRSRAEAAERAKLQATCSAVFRSTADRKVLDLTVRESQQVKACDSLGMYHL